MKANNLEELLIKWKRQNLLCYITSLWATTIIMLIMSIYIQITDILTIALLLFGLIAMIIHWRNRLPQMEDLIQITHLQNPSLEYSAHLLTTTPSNLLEQLQQAKISDQFSTFSYRLPLPIQFCSIWSIGIISLLSIITLCYPMVQAADAENQSLLSMTSAQDTQLSTIDSLSIISLDIDVRPPAYTSLANRKAQTKSLDIPEGSKVQWSIEWSGQADLSYILLSAGDTIAMDLYGQHQRYFYKSDNYRYGFKYNDQKFISDYYPIQVTKDQSATLSISGIEEYTRLPWHIDHNISFNIELSDDYGISDVKLIATIAKGKGESVKFRERAFTLNGFIAGSRKFQGTHQLSTIELEMQAGDELYFYIVAQDNCPFRSQISRSSTYFIAIEDTTTYVDIDDASMQVDLMPDFFRSQRQIIIDSEHLLSIRNNISIDSFNRLSNELGYDQKMLRLKYGQFMGDESESGIAIENDIHRAVEDDHDHDHDHHHEEHDHDHQENSILTQARALLGSFIHDHDHEEEEGLLMATRGTEKEEAVKPSWVKALSHNHDNMEEASFHNASIKSKLRAAMSEMWDAELHLRLFKPDNSLPYQYRSLSLLQEIKNHARIYVHRIGFDPPIIIEQEKRLTGDLDEIIDSRSTKNRVQLNPYDQLIALIKALDSNKNNVLYIQQIQNILGELAIDRPELLPLLSSLQLMGTPTDEDLYTLKSNLSKVIPNEIAQANTSPVNSHKLSVQIAKALRSK